MIKKKKLSTNKELLEKFDDNSFSLMVKDKKEEAEVKKELQRNGIPFSLGYIPEMLNGNVVGVKTQITVTDKQKLQTLLHNGAEREDKGQEGNS